MLECFVYSELLKVNSLPDDPIVFYHYRDMDQFEVDLVLEGPAGKLVGIEVKARAAIRPRDFRGLRRMQEMHPDQFACGVALHDGEHLKRVDPGLLAMPVKMLWE